MPVRDPNRAAETTCESRLSVGGRRGNLEALFPSTSRIARSESTVRWGLAQAGKKALGRHHFQILGVLTDVPPLVMYVPVELKNLRTVHPIGQY